MLQIYEFLILLTPQFTISPIFILSTPTHCSMHVTYSTARNSKIQFQSQPLKKYPYYLSTKNTLHTHTTYTHYMHTLQHTTFTYNHSLLWYTKRSKPIKRISNTSSFIPNSVNRNHHHANYNSSCLRSESMSLVTPFISKQQIHRCTIFLFMHSLINHSEGK